MQRAVGTRDRDLARKERFTPAHQKENLELPDQRTARSHDDHGSLVLPTTFDPAYRHPHQPFLGEDEEDKHRNNVKEGNGGEQAVIGEPELPDKGLDEEGEGLVLLGEDERI